jgi:RNA polymerase sigma-54 factor
MEVRPGISIAQKTQLVLTPRMRQALCVLQAPVIELAEILRECLIDNPFLEEVAGGDEDDTCQGREVLETAGNEPAARETDPGVARNGGDPSAPGAGVVASTPWGWENGGGYESVPQAVEPWQAALLRQFRFCSRGGDGESVAEYILGCLDRRGYLAVSLKEIAAANRVSLAEVERVRGIVLRLDPPGLGARDLKECLLVQLEQRDEGHTLAARIVAAGLELLARRRFDALAEEMAVSSGEVAAAARRIRSLWPRPLNLVERDATQPVFPDLVVAEIEGRFEVLLSDRILPRVRVALPTAGMLKRADRQTRVFVAERLARARWLMGSLDARRRTLVALMRQIVAEQRGFFEKGVHGLRPLTYRYVADRMGLHESTVARAVQGKHVQTPGGIFPLRFFFSKGFATRAGEDRVPASIARRVRELVDAEDKARPLTDAEITRALRRDGLRIARRTVAKYRDRSRIPMACYRKQL